MSISVTFVSSLGAPLGVFIDNNDLAPRLRARSFNYGGAGQIPPSGAPETVTESRWHQPWSEPVRQKPGLRANLQQPFATNANWIIDPSRETLRGWYNWFSEPVRFKRGLPTPLQQSFTGPPRLLPRASVTMTIAATEVNTDVFLGAINVYTGTSTTVPGQGAQVSIEEIPIPGNSKVSNKGN